jgi:anti-anti-sigma factor
MTNREGNNVSVAVLSERIVFEKESNALREQLKCLITHGNQKIALDMKNVAHIDGSGLGTLVAAHVNARAQGVSLLLCRVGPNFQRVLELTKLARIFQVCNTDATAGHSEICVEPACPVCAIALI